jgi:hypothetical protein
MAERRMFSKQIIDSDAFLNMPLSSQVLYFHLAMRADDDGFINNTQKIIRMIGATPDDFNILAAKKYILTFDTGVIVIRHWKMHNYIQSDRYKPTIHHEEKAQLELKKDKTYTNNQQCIQNGYNMDTQVRLGKVRLGKVSKTLDHFETFWSAYPKKIGKQKCRVWFEKNRVDNNLLQKMTNTIEQQKQTEQWNREDGRYIPHPYTWLNQGRWDDEIPQSRWNQIDMEGF